MLDELTIRVTRRHELFMSTSTGDRSSIHYDDRVDMTNCRIAMCDDDGRPSCTRSIEFFLNFEFISWIKRARRFIEDQDVRVSYECSSYADALPLAT